MICRFCGKHTDSIKKCDVCFKENPVVIEYKSYSNEEIIDKLSSLAEIFSIESNLKSDSNINEIQAISDEIVKEDDDKEPALNTDNKKILKIMLKIKSNILPCLISALVGASTATMICLKFINKNYLSENDINSTLNESTYPVSSEKQESKTYVITTITTESVKIKTTSDKVKTTKCTFVESTTKKTTESVTKNPEINTMAEIQNAVLQGNSTEE